MKSILFSILILTFSGSNLFSRENIKTNHGSPQRMQSGCSPSTAITDLDIGNVRAYILINGDMWWDLIGSPLYEVPKGSGKNSLYTGALWIGGLDDLGNLKIAAQTYRQGGSDFWPGPVDTLNVDVNGTTCNAYNRFWKISRQEVYDFVHGGSPSADIQSWPGNGNPVNNEAHFLAPFIDVNNDGEYHWQDGDYPAYDFSVSGGSTNCNTFLNGDQTIWWVFNDVGNVHTETGSTSNLGLEIRAQAFAFGTTNVNVSNSTFYHYEIINRSVVTIHDTWLGQYVDPDLGNYDDDYVGCDVARNVGYAYNGDADDDGPLGYGLLPPAVGMMLLQGPLADPNDGKDNDRDSVIDEAGEEIKMSRFVYYNNNLSNTGNPLTAIHFYNYLRGLWKDGAPMLYGGTGYQSGGDSCFFMFPGESDPYGWGGLPGLFPWSEFQTTAGGNSNIPGDRRFLMSSGNFEMLPGEVKFLTTAAIWGRATSNTSGITSSVEVLQSCADEIQSIFDNCFTAIPTGISEKVSDALIQLYPNPAKNFFEIKLVNSDQHIKNIILYNSMGERVMDRKVMDEKSIRIDTSPLLSGIYYYSVKLKNGLLKSGKIVISGN